MTEFRRVLFRSLKAIQSKGLVFRDIKPQNLIQLKGDDGVAFIDFEGAVEEGYIEEDFIYGTEGYISPERCSVEDLELSYSTDTYSLGCVFHEIITGNLPYQLWLNAPIPINPKNNNFDSLETKCASSDLTNFIQRMCSFDPESRPQDANEIIETLERIE